MLQYQTKQDILLFCIDLLAKALLSLNPFLSGLEDFLSNVLCSKSQFTIILVDFNARSLAWWSEDSATLHALQIKYLSLRIYKSKMIFNPDLSKQEQEVIFSRKTNNKSYPFISC